MKQLLLQVGAAVLAAAVVSCGAGIAVANAGGSGVVIALRDIGIILLALFSLVGTLIAGGIWFGGAWAVGRFGGKATAGFAFVKRWTLKIETKVEDGTDRFAVRPLAKAARFLTQGARLVEVSLRPGERVSSLRHYPEAAVRGVTSLLRQERHKAPALRDR